MRMVESVRGREADEVLTVKVAKYVRFSRAIMLLSFSSTMVMDEAEMMGVNGEVS